MILQMMISMALNHGIRKPRLIIPSRNILWIKFKTSKWVDNYRREKRLRFRVIGQTREPEDVSKEKRLQVPWKHKKW